MPAEQKWRRRFGGKEPWWKQVPENSPDTGSFSLSHLAQPPASTHILSAVCLANCFFSSRGLALLRSPVICSSPFALSGSCFQRMEAGEMQSRNCMTEGQAAQVRAEDPKWRGTAVELAVEEESPNFTLPSRSRAGGSAGRWSPPSGDPSSQMPSLARWRFLFCSEKAVGI